jgi:hypothetical protein
MADSRAALCDRFLPEIHLHPRLQCAHFIADPPPADPELTCPEVEWIYQQIDKLVGFCDLACRASTELVRGLPPEGAELVRTRYLDEACACATPPYELADDAYGVAGNVVRIASEAKHYFKLARQYTQEAFYTIQRARATQRWEEILWADSTPQEAAAVLDETFAKLAECEDESPLLAFRRLLEDREFALKTGYFAYRLLKCRVVEHALEREDKGTIHLATLHADAFSRIALHLDTRSAVALMRTCAEFRRSDALTSRTPHMRVRKLLGDFPHARVMSRDRDGGNLARDQSKHVLRDFVVARRAVRLYVDFVLPRLRATPLCKKDGKYEAPESAQRRGPTVTFVSEQDAETAWGRRALDAAQRRRRRWAAAEGPEEPPDPHIEYQRIDYSGYFRDTPQITPKLVFADSLEPVPCARFEHGLMLSNQMLRDGGCFAPPANWQASDRLPAVAKFHIPHLTLDHGGRLFCIELHATATTWTKGQFSQVVRTPPFEVVSKLQVVGRAGSRETASELREARRRARLDCTSQ